MEDLLHKGKNILFFDIETVGFPKKGQPIGIIEVGLQFIPNLGFSKKVETLSQLYSVNEKIPYEITQITGIKESMLVGMPNIHDHFDLIQDKINRADIVVAHNAPFDIRCLEATGFNFIGKEVFDTKTHSKRMFPELENHKMSTVCEHLGVINEGSHRAIFDVNAMIQVYAKMTDMNEKPKEIQAILEKFKKLTYTKELSKKAN